MQPSTIDPAQFVWTDFVCTWALSRTPGGLSHFPLLSPLSRLPQAAMASALPTGIRKEVMVDDVFALGPFLVTRGHLRLASHTLINGGLDAQQHKLWLLQPTRPDSKALGSRRIRIGSIFLHHTGSPDHCPGHRALWVGRKW